MPRTRSTIIEERIEEGRIVTDQDLSDARTSADRETIDQIPEERPRTRTTGGF